MNRHGSTERDHFVYRAFADDGSLLYVGCTMRPKQRWANHRSASAWARLAVRFRVSGPYTFDTARRLERHAQQTENPQYGDTPARRSLRRRRDCATQRTLDRLIASGVSVNDAVPLAIAEGARLVLA